jgi:hypothetical protein
MLGVRRPGINDCVLSFIGMDCAYETTGRMRRKRHRADHDPEEEQGTSGPVTWSPNRRSFRQRLSGRIGLHAVSLLDLQYTPFQ